jgi:hypothetical protein
LESKALALGVFLESKALALGVFLESKALALGVFLESKVLALGVFLESKALALGVFCHWLLAKITVVLVPKAEALDSKIKLTLKINGLYSLIFFSLLPPQNCQYH